MKGPIIKRFISDREAFKDIKNDFKFLVDKIKKSGFEYDLQIRDNYFNLYYKGNSIGKIAYKKNSGQYEITIHHQFVNNKIIDKFADDKTKEIASSDSKKKGYLKFTIRRSKLHPFFSTQNLNSISIKVKKVNFQEEIIFEQMLITDNANREDFIIIDRQVIDKDSKTKMDLLALKKTKDNDYQFCIIEVKLGNNPELEGDVIFQLKGYVDRIEKRFADYKKCYEQNFIQKRELKIIDKPTEIKIVRDVIGAVVVIGYSGLARQSIKKLKRKDPSFKVIQFTNRLDLKKLKQMK